MTSKLALLGVLMLSGCAIYPDGPGHHDDNDNDSRGDEDPGATSDHQPATPTKGESKVGCAFADPASPEAVVMAFGQNENVVFVRADRTSFVAHTFDATPVAEDGTTAPVTLFLRSAGDFVAAIALKYVGASEVWEAVLLNRAGERLWQGKQPGYQYFPAYLGESGAVAFRLYEQGATLVAWPNGTQKEYPGTEPLAAPTAEGKLLVRTFQAKDEPGEVRWLNLESGSLDPVEAAAPLAYPLFGGAPVPIEGGVVYAGLESGTPILVREKGGQVAKASSPTATPAIEAATPGGTALVSAGLASWSSSRWIADIGAGTSLPVAPLGELGPFGYGALATGPSLESDGRAVAVLRDEHKGGLFQSVGGEAGWTPIGGTYTGILDVSYIHRAGTFVVIGSEKEGYFPTKAWEKAPEGDEPNLTGAVAQVVRMASGEPGQEGVSSEWRELPAGARDFAVTPDGECVAFVQDNMLSAVDMSTLTSFTILESNAKISGTPLWLSAK